ncbi:MAG: hypothetical protein ACUVXJ_16545, partial [Phycisphaerae bacterium]
MSSDRTARPHDRQSPSGVIHTYQKFDPKNFPSPTSPPPDVLSPAFQHMLVYGSMRELTEEELARAVHIDPGQIPSLGPSLESLIAMLLERKRKILATYEPQTVQQEVRDLWQKEYRRARVPSPMANTFYSAARGEQLYDLERLWYHAERKAPEFAARLLALIELLGQKYQIDELAARYEFTGRTPMNVPTALAVKEELEAIDRLLGQLR